MPDPHPLLTIGALAAATNVNVETIRFYQRRGLLAQPQRMPGSIRRYGGGELSRLRFIKSAQRLGFSLDEIADLLTLEDGSGCARARAKAQAKLADIRQKLADLRSMEQALDALVSLCGTASGKVRCPLIAALDQPAASARASRPLERSS